MKKQFKRILLMGLVASMFTTTLSAAEPLAKLSPKNNIANVWSGSPDGPFADVDAVCILNVLYFSGYRSRALSYNIQTGRPFFCKKESNTIYVYTEKKYVH